MLKIILSSLGFTQRRFFWKKYEFRIYFRFLFFLMMRGRNHKLGSVLEHEVGPQRNAEGRK